jgi:hypothetical protein
MTKVVIVGEIFYSDLAPGQGLPPLSPGAPAHPIYGPPPYPDQGLPPGPSHPIAPPPPIVGIWPGPTPGHPIVIPPGTPVTPPPTLPTPPGELANQMVVAIYIPGQGWTTSSYPLTPTHPIPPVPQPQRG